MIGHAALVQGDAARLPLANESVDLVVTSPPYFGQRNYQDADGTVAGQVGQEDTPASYVDALTEVTAELVRVLKPTGSIFVNLGDRYNGSGGPGTKGTIGATMVERSGGMTAYRKVRDIPRKSLIGIPWRYALACVDALGLTLRAELIWYKPSSVPERPGDRVRRCHETWFHFTTGPRYYAAVSDLIENKTPTSAGVWPGSVWTMVNTGVRVPDWSEVRHTASFPQEWPRRLILGWCPPGGVVLDPFVGSGTTPMVARALGCVGLGVDLSAAYLNLARWRIWQSGHGAKSEQRTYRERQGRLAL